MTICGVQKLTLLDYPGQVACTVFLGGCNFRCPFCHNSQLLTDAAPQAMTEQALLEFLRRRQGILDGVCITGGEPTLHRQLPQLMGAIQALGYRVKLDTNGSNPQMLSQLMEQGLVDYVAMDVKNGPEDYARTAGAAVDLAAIRKSLELLLFGPVDYELRTTVVHPLHSRKSLTAMAHWLADIGGGQKVKRLYLQLFVDRDTVPQQGLSAPDRQTMEEYLRAVSFCAQESGLRGL